MKRIGVMTSGGDAPGMNAAIRSVVRCALANDMNVIGFKRGYNGMLMRSKESSDDFAMMTAHSVSDKIHRGGTFLMTARCPEFKELEAQKRAVSNLKMLGVEGMVMIGGDGTFRGAADLDKLGLPVIGIPGTIDNDLGYTDMTIGFDTALNTACECLNRIRETSDSHERASLVTVMGRNCGDIAVHTALACGAEIVLVPEVKWSIEEVAERVKWGVLKGKSSMIIIVAEGAFASMTSDVAQISRMNENLTGIEPSQMDSSHLAKMIEALSGHDTRATVLGYIQRGGSPTATDRILATRMGRRAVELLRDDCSGLAIGMRENRLIEVPICEARGRAGEISGELLGLIATVSG
jgi:6-phosphofructokinase 1